MNTTINSNELHVIFGTGPLGTSVAQALAARGIRTKMVNRSGKRTSDIPAGAEVVAADAYDLSQARNIAHGANAIYNCTNAPYHEWATKLKPLYGNILQSAIDHKARYIMGDNVYAYGDTNGAVLTENTPMHPNTRKGQLRKEIAEIVLAAHQSGQTPTAIVRASDFVGPGVTSAHLGDLLVAPALLGKTGQLVGNIDQPHTSTFIGDIGKAMVLVALRENAFGQVWHAPNDAPTTLRQAAQMIYDEAGHKMKLMVAGRYMLSLMGLFSPTLREIKEMLYQFEKPFVVNSEKFEREFGVKAQPLALTIKQTVAWYRSYAEQQKQTALVAA